MANGERILGAAFGLLGLAWVVMALDLTYMGDFAPGSGFLPLWLGIALVTLSGIFLATTWKKPPPAGGDLRPRPSGARARTAFISVGLFVCVGMLDLAGFAVSVAAYLFYLVKIVERHSLLAALCVSIGATLSLILIFRTWLGVPFPEGPWGF
jgi:hypothetical protein